MLSIEPELGYEVTLVKDAIGSFGQAEMNASLQFNMPAYATSSYITQFAQYVKANLNPNLKVYIEYGNEDWSNLNPAGNTMNPKAERLLKLRRRLRQ